MTRRRIELSCDLGEATTRRQEEVESALWPMIDAANIACGGHVGDEGSMSRAIGQALRHGSVVGAHPSYPDRESFGRKRIVIDDGALLESLRDQIGTLARLAAKEGAKLDRVKPHGALYNDAHRDERLAGVIIEAVREFDAAIVCPSRSAMAVAARRAGVPTVREAFADRRYLPDTSLMPRSEEGSLLIDVDEAAEQALRLAERSEVTAAGGSVVRIDFDTICVHGDMPDAVARLRRIRETLRVAGYG